MENFGILLSVPAAFVAATGYEFLVVVFRYALPAMAPTLLRLSHAVLTALILEWLLLALLGPVGARRQLGPLFGVTHLLVFFLAIPSLVNVLVLGRQRMQALPWYVISCAGALLGFVLVVEQYAVSEALYGETYHPGPFRWP